MSHEQPLQPDEIDQDGGVNFGIYDKMTGQKSETGLIRNLGIMDTYNKMTGPAPAAPPAAPVPEPMPAPMPEPVPAPIPEPAPAPIPEPAPQPVAPEMHPEVAAFAAAKEAETAANNLISQGDALIAQGTQVVQEAQAQQQGLVAQGSQIMQDAQAKQQELTAQGNELKSKGNNDLNAALTAQGKAPLLPPGSTVREAYDATATGLNNAGQAISGTVGAINENITGALGNAGSAIGNWFGSLTPAQQQEAAQMTPEQQALAAQKGGFFDNAQVKGGTRKHKAKKQRKSKKAKKSKKRGSKKNKSKK
jgi:hypothetical protein